MSSLIKRTFGWLGLAVAGVIAGPIARVQAQDWIRQFGTSGDDFFLAMAPDGADGIMTAGSTFGPLGGPHVGGFDGFLARHDIVGEPFWIRQFGITTDDGALALAPDGAGGVMVAGFTTGSLGGPHGGGSDVFLARHNSAGARLWIRQFSTNRDEVARALAPDGVGGVIVAGWTGGSLGGANAGREDAFLARYDSAGERLWIRQFGTNFDDEAVALAPDGAGGVMVAGVTRGNLGGPNAGGLDAFLARYDDAGERIWIRQFGTSSSDVALALAPDGADGVMVTGWTGGSLGGSNAGADDVFLARYDGAGERLWIRQVGTGADDFARALAPDGAGGVMVAGATRGNLGGPNAGRWDAFLARYDSTGERLSIRQFGTSGDDFVWALKPDGPEGVIAAGETWGSLGDPNAGGADAFLARFKVCDPCDMNCDGRVNASDIEFFIDLLFNGAPNCNPCTGDTNGDGFIDAADIEGFIECLFP